MSDGTGRIVQATAGRDSGDVFFVVGQTADGRLLLADGKRRKAARRPKSSATCVCSIRSLTTPSSRSCNKENRRQTGN